jgi:hypothetical protein
MLQNLIGKIFSGRPVYSGFQEKMHVSDKPFGPREGFTIHIGIDFGLTPAACFTQDVYGQVRVFDELVAKDMHAKQFAKALNTHINNRGYDKFNLVFTGDPAGDSRVGTDGMTAYQIFKAAGIDIQPASTNEPEIRIGAVQTQINTLVDGLPGYFLSSGCSYLLAAKKGGYAFLKDREEVDKKSIYSHISDAEQYALIRMGYGKKLVRRDGANIKVSTQASFRQDVFAQGRGRALTGRAARQKGIISRGLLNRS